MVAVPRVDFRATSTVRKTWLGRIRDVCFHQSTTQVDRSVYATTAMSTLPYKMPSLPSANSACDGPASSPLDVLLLSLVMIPTISTWSLNSPCCYFDRLVQEREVVGRCWVHFFEATEAILATLNMLTGHGLWL